MAMRSGAEEVARLPAPAVRPPPAASLEHVRREVGRGQLGQHVAGGLQRRRGVGQGAPLGHQRRGVVEGGDLVIGLGQEGDQLAGIGQLHQPLLDERHHPQHRLVVQRIGQEGPQAQCQLLIGQAANVDPVQVVQPILVEDGAALVHVRQVEAGDQLVQREDLLLGARAPAQEGEEVDHRLRQVALLAVGGDRRLRLALAHLRAVGIQDQRDVPEARLAVAERPDQGDVLGRVRDVVLAADDVADLHLLVVDHDHEVVQRRAIGAHDDEVAEQAVVELDLAADQVVEAHHLGLAP